MKIDNTLNVCCISDEKYIQLLKPFLRSLYASNPDVYTHVTLVDCESKNQEISSIHSNIKITNDNIKLSTKRKHLDKHGIPLFDNLHSKKRKSITGGFDGPKYLLSDKACYCSNIRYRVISDVLSTGAKAVVFMDVDAIIRRPLSGLTDNILNNDITIMKEVRGFNSEVKYVSDKYAPDDHIDWHCGIIGIKNNPITQEIFKVLQARTEADMYNWDADQEQFNIMYKEYKNKFKLGSITHEYKDEGYKREGYTSDAYIWCGAGEQKYSNQQYVTEQNKWV